MPWVFVGLSHRPIFGVVVSALSQKQTFRSAIVMSALPPKADMCSAAVHVRFGPIADIRKNSALAERKTPDIAPGLCCGNIIFSEHAIRTLSNACRVAGNSSVDLAATGMSVKGQK